MSSLAIIWLVVKAVLFLAGAVIVGRLVYRPMFRVANFLRVHGCF
jgi:hypothetical protein